MSFIFAYTNNLVSFEASEFYHVCSPKRLRCSLPVAVSDCCTI